MVRDEARQVLAEGLMWWSGLHPDLKAVDLGDRIDEIVTALDQRGVLAAGPIGPEPAVGAMVP